MVVKSNNMEKQVRSELKGGKGDIHFLNCVSKDTIPNCRLLSYMTIPPEGSIGEHEHVEETECYVIKSGKGVVIDLIIQNTSISSLRVFDTDYITEKYLISRCFDSSTIFFV